MTDDLELYQACKDRDAPYGNRQHDEDNFYGLCPFSILGHKCLTRSPVSGARSLEEQKYL
jgi:hypothetical protein